MDKKGFAGKPLVAVIDEICSRVTPRWKTGGFDFDIFDQQSIKGPGIGRGLWILDAPETAEDRQHDADWKAIKAAIQPLFSAIKEGELVVLAIRLPDDGSEPKPIPLGNWKRQWKIDLSEPPETFTVVDASGASTVFELGTVELPRLSGQTPAAEPAAKLTKSATKTGKVGGRPEKFNWAKFEGAIGKKLFDEGLPKRGDGGQARLQEWAKDWFEDNYASDKWPEESTIKKRIRGILKRYRAEQVEGEKPQLFPKVSDKKA